jgi:hypothetical protein
MKHRTPYLAAAIAALGILAGVAAAARAETAALEIKRLSGPRNRVGTDYLYRYTSSQSFNAAVGPQGSSRISFGDARQRDEAFKKLVTKEPKYESEYPFRGIAKLGSHEYPFVLDAVAEKKTDDKKADDENLKPANLKPAEEAKKDAPAAEEKKDAEKKEEPPKAIHYNRLYFDANHNGDLTDDKVIEPEAGPQMVISGGSYANFSFPAIELTVDADGTPVEYAFTVSGYMVAQKEYSYAGVQLNAAAYREGEITLDGKKHRLAVIDFNSNGRYDDQIEIMGGGNDRVYPKQGDMLLLDPDSQKSDYPYDPARSTFRNYVSKLICLDGKYYDVKITPAGDKITLDPSTVPLGKVSNKSDGYSAVIYGEQGFLKISGGKDNPASVPAGEWKLLSYSIDLTEPVKPPEEKPKTDDEGEKKTTPKALSSAIKNLLGSTATRAVPAIARRTVVSAQATGDYKPVKVVANETAEMPFGPPYKPVVTSYLTNQIVDGKPQSVTRLSMSLVGSAGENCTDLMVGGARPGKPEFTITDPEDKVVQTGNFEYG